MFVKRNKHTIIEIWRCHCKPYHFLNMLPYYDKARIDGKKLELFDMETSFIFLEIRCSAASVYSLITSLWKFDKQSIENVIQYTFVWPIVGLSVGQEAHAIGSDKLRYTMKWSVDNSHWFYNLISLLHQ